MSIESLPSMLHRLRKANNYKQNYVAEKLGIAQQTYSHYETGARIPDSEILYNIAKLYHVSMDTLMGGGQAERDRPELHDHGAGPYTVTAMNRNELLKFLEYLEQDNVSQKTRLLDADEKELLFYYASLPAEDKNELLEIAKIKRNFSTHRRTIRIS